MLRWKLHPLPPICRGVLGLELFGLFAAGLPGAGTPGMLPPRLPCCLCALYVCHALVRVGPGRHGALHWPVKFKVLSATVSLFIPPPLPPRWMHAPKCLQWRIAALQPVS